MNSSKNTLSSWLKDPRLVLIKPFITRLLLGLSVMLVTIGIQLLFPKAVAFLIDNLTTTTNQDWHTQVVLSMVAGLIFYCLATALRFYIFDSTGELIVTQLKRKLYHSILHQEIGFFDTHKVGELISRISSDVETLKDTLSMNVAIAIRSCLVLIGAAIMMFTISLKLSFLVLITLPLSILLAKWLGKKVRNKSKAVQHSRAASVHFVQENLTNIRLVRSFNQESKSNNGYSSGINKVLSNNLDNIRLFAMFQGLSTFLSYFSLIIILWIGGSLILGSHLSVGEITSFILYASMAVAASSAVSGFWGEWMKSYGATERVFELINRKPKFTAPLIAAHPNSIKGEIEFNQVTFSYPGRPENKALNRLSLKIEAGEKVALLGSSGAGKSTVANLILGFYEPTEGEVLFDGVKAMQWSNKTIRDSIATVEQEPSLFSGTIGENIGYSLQPKDFCIDAIESAAKEANAHQFIIQFPLGYDTIVGDRGVQLSGGQKQRIAIARALLKNPTILILDEATSALDSESEYQVQVALDKLMRGRTTLMIAHRYSTIAKADRLLVMNQGKIEQHGLHDQLMKQKQGMYYRLMQNQIHRYANNSE